MKMVNKIPAIGFALLLEGGFFISLPFKPISLNEFKKMHHGRIKKDRDFYKSILDVVLVTCIKKNYMKDFDENGLHLSRSIFNERIYVQWILNFDINLKRDTGNYVQKTLMDAIVDTGIIEDDNSQFIRADSVMFGDGKQNSITCTMIGEVHRPMFKNSISIIKYDNLLKGLEVTIHE